MREKNISLRNKNDNEPKKKKKIGRKRIQIIESELR